MQSFGLSAAVWPELQCQIMPSAKVDPAWELGWTWGSKMVQIEMSIHIPIRLLYTLYAYLAPFGHNTQRGRRQTERSEHAAYTIALVA